MDYGLLDADGALLGNPFHYRDARTEAGAATRSHAVVPPAELYARNGLQYLPFNTLYQLVAAGRPLGRVRGQLLLIPDLLGVLADRRASGAELTNASTTGLLDVRTGEWAASSSSRLGVRPDIFPTAARPGRRCCGPLSPRVRPRSAPTSP